MLNLPSAEVPVPARRTLLYSAGVSVLAYLACIPSFSPIWPRGMSELGERERFLNGRLSAASDLGSARAFLRAQGIDTYEYDETAEQVVLQRANFRIVAKPGEHVMSARVDTGAQQFPCSYRIDVILVFDPNGRLEQNYIRRFPLCP